MNMKIRSFLKILLLVTCGGIQAQDSLDFTQNSMLRPQNRSYDKVLAEALVLQIRADSLSRIARDLRIQAKEAIDESIRKQFASDIILAEREAKSTQLLADKQFTLANSLKPAAVKQEPVENSSVQLSREINGIRVYQYTGNSDGTEIEYISPEEPATGEENTEKPAPAVPLADLTLATTGNKEVSKPVKTDEFAILEKSPYSDVRPIQQGLGTNRGLIYRIQLGVFSKIRPNDAFGGITPVVYEPFAGGSMFKYYAGLFYSMNSVTEALVKVRAAGFPDAFLVAFFDGKPITTEKAREIEFSEFKMNSN